MTGFTQCWRDTVFLSPDGKLILAARGIRTFAYGFLSILLGLYLDGLGFSPLQVGAVLTTTLAGSAALTILFTSVADRYGRRRMLSVSAVLMAGAGLLFALTNRYPLLILASLTGTIGATSGEVGPFLSLEQTILPQTVPPQRRNMLFGIYNTVGGLAGAAGSLFAATPVLLQRWLGWTELTALRIMFVLYAALAGIALVLILRLSPRVELSPEDRALGGGLRESKRMVMRLSALFGLDSLAGGFVVQSLIAFWFHLRWGAGPELLGPIFLGVGVLQAASYLVAARVADRIGLINTMVFTHLPSNVLLMLVPAAPTLGAAIALILARHALAQMDVPTRQSYTMTVVAPAERAAAAGYTNVVRNLAQAVTPVISGYAMQVLSLGLPFVIGGGLKIIYDLTLFAMFRHTRVREDTR
ncbi:MAG: MFS transporter [Armatimonadetes bacterium]|nr:MFS transporter [Armatimonadota bacterium]MBI2973247.1 MFS transporter [Armatimonadota bacterium]